ncbi:amidophosphoribosyltransferase [Streptomyces sp. JB150]|uniref:amidophosphoribosyltransferase n=1 Tax=Streptomyces sp. JB150 TaxID=2714844 RepID=UPI00140C5EFA|nr:amidophosphoribosyltransferase [Streptomyces sp. JB150]QIJ65454.1 amidophosphoribosyltransferase [Streptomyces sp. JB150]
MSDPTGKPREACGVAGVWGATGDAAPLVRTMLTALQHRGRQNAGIVACHAGRLDRRAGAGRVSDVFPALADLPRGPGAVGHVRYATSGDAHGTAGTGAPGTDLAQPVLAGPPGRPTLAVAHNGTLVDAEALAIAHGARYGPGGSDTALLTRLLHTVMERGADLSAALHEVLPAVTGAYALVLTDGRRMYGVRDPHGFRPLCLGRLDDTWLLASESPALTAVGAEPVRELEPGEVLEVGPDGMHSGRLTVQGARRAFCLFEYVYFARPDSVLDARSVYRTRYAAGIALAEHAPPPPDAADPVVVAVPETARVAADGYAFRSGLPLVQGLLRHDSVGRSFIGGSPDDRAAAVRAKLTAVPAAVAGRPVLLVDDSLVRGTTMAAIVTLLRDAGARAIHVRIASPPHRWPCHYGIDTGRGDSLLAAGITDDRIARRLGCDTAAFLPLHALIRSVDKDPYDLCTACLDGRYPTAVPGGQPTPRTRRRALS